MTVFKSGESDLLVYSLMENVLPPAQYRRVGYEREGVAPGQDSKFGNRTQAYRGTNAL